MCNVSDTEVSSEEKYADGKVEPWTRAYTTQGDLEEDKGGVERVNGDVFPSVECIVERRRVCEEGPKYNRDNNS